MQVEVDNTLGHIVNIMKMSAVSESLDTPTTSMLTMTGSMDRMASTLNTGKVTGQITRVELISTSSCERVSIRGIIYGEKDGARMRVAVSPTKLKERPQTMCGVPRGCFFKGTLPEKIIYLKVGNECTRDDNMEAGE
jgi:hypothetical protein